MYKYRDFAEYLQLNYLEHIKEKLGKFIETNELVFGMGDSDKIHRYEDYKVNKLKIIRVIYTKNKRGKVDFDVHLKAEYIICDKIYDPSSEFPQILEKKGCFCYKMTGSFKDGFRGKNEIEKMDEEPDELISSTLVPIISDSEMDEYATKFLKEFCPEALETPMKLDLNKMLRDKGIQVYFAPLPDCILGKTYFAKDKETIYKDDNDDFSFSFGETEEIEVEPGTIIINYDKMMERTIGSYRNTIVHEAVHWFFHSNFFELKHLLNNEMTCAVCCKGDYEYESDDIAWMEHQAKAIAPRILMPKKMALQKWNEILGEVQEKSKEKEWTKTQILETAFKKFVKFFDVSKQSARIRLKELGIKDVEGLLTYGNGKVLKSYFYSCTLSKNETFTINEDELRELLKTNIFLQDALIHEKIFYINNMLVVNNPKYVNAKKYELTSYALEHADECCLKFSIERYGITKNGEITKNFLLSSTSNRRETKDVIMEHAQKILPISYESFSHYEQHKKELPDTFSGTFSYHYEKMKENGKIHSYDDLEMLCDISSRTLGKYARGEVIPNRTEVLKLCIGMKLSAPYIMDMLNKADCPLIFNNAENSALLTALYSYPRVGLDNMYLALRQNGLEGLLHISEKWLRENNLA